MPYDNPKRELIQFIQTDFGAGTGLATSFKGPKGHKGKLVDMGLVDISETFACDTTTAKVRVGTAADPDAYAEMIIPDATATTDAFRASQDDTDAIIDNDLPADTQIEVTFVQSADSVTAAGIAIPFVVVEWFK